jgi:hypothetical protein
MSLRSAIIRFAKSSLAVTSTELTQIFGIVECLKDFLQRKALAFLKRHSDKPLLICVQGDGTWQKSKLRQSYGIGDLVVRRTGSAGHDVYLQRAFLRSDTESMLLIDEPTSMSEGKSSWHCFSSYKRFLGFLEDARSSHNHAMIRFFCYDRLQYSSLMNIHMADHRLQSHELALAHPESLNERQLILTDLTVGRACGDHDCQNSLKWALDPLHPVSATETYEQLHIIIASVRNGFDIISRELPDWLVNIIQFSDVRYDGYEFWIALGIEPKWLDEICELELRFQDGRLIVKQDMQNTNDWVDRVSGVLMYLWNMQDFTATRWLTLGGVSKVLVRSLASGLHDIVSRALANPKNSKYYLGGFARLNDELRFFLVTLSLAAYPADAFMLSSLEDDRVALKADEMQNAVNEELQYLSNISSSTIERLAQIAHVAPGKLLHAVHACSLRSVAFLDWRVFSDANALPWSLCRGDISSNLENLKNEPSPADLNARKLLVVLSGIM